MRVDTSDVAGVFGWFSSYFVLENGQVKPEMIINIDSAAIIALVIPISWMIRRMKKVVAMIIGMLVSLVCGLRCDQSGLALLLDGVRVCDRGDDLQPDVQRLHRPDRPEGKDRASAHKWDR